MNIRFLYSRLKNLIVKPERAWEIINRESRPLSYMQASYFFPMITLASLAALTGSLLFIHGGLTYVYPIFLGVRYFLFFLLLTYLTAFVFNEATSAMDLGKDFTRAFKVIGFSMAPLFICMTVSLLFESLLFINLLALYGLYLFWCGVEEMVAPPEHKRIPLMVSSVVAFAILYILIHWVLNKVILDIIYFNLFR